MSVSVVPSNALSDIKANILIDQNGHARLADFGLLVIVSDPASFIDPSSAGTARGTVRWMSPELFHPDKFGLKGSRPTKESDYYALGMVVYEVLSGKVPFAPFGDIVVMRKVTDGERPERPKQAEGAWFTDDIWDMLNRSWAPQPKSRPNVEAVLECLEQIPKTWKPPPQQANEDAGVDEDVEEDEDDWNYFTLESLLPVRFPDSIPPWRVPC